MNELDYFPDRVEFVIDKLGGPSEFARQTGVTLSTIARWRKGEADPSRSNLIKIAEVAEVSLEWLATGRTYEEADIFIEQHKPKTVQQALQALQEAQQALQEAIATQPPCNPSHGGIALEPRELQLLEHYRASDKEGKIRIEATAEAIAGLTATSDGIKEEQVA